MKESIGQLEGKITIGPLRPGPVRMGDPEPEPPKELFASHKIVVFREDRSSKVLEVGIDPAGHYRAELPAGTYWIDFEPHDIGFKRGNPPQQVVIQAGKTTHLDLDIDTGMR